MTTHRRIGSTRPRASVQADPPTSALRILHGNAYASPNVIDGVNSSVWIVAREQAALGHAVGIILGEPSDEVRDLAAGWGVRLFVIGPTTAAYARGVNRILRRWRPDVLHLHSTFTPRLAIASFLADRAKVPRVLTPHGGLRPFYLGHASRKQVVYARLVERPRFSGAAAITALLPAEAELVTRFVPRFSGLLTLVPSPADDPEPSSGMQARTGPIAYLGRYDVTTKGLDRWLEIAQLLPAHDFAMYGEGADHGWLTEQRPPNVTVNDPVFAREKHDVLATTSLYLQTSRWDASPLAICEAMLAGAPCAISETMNFARAFEEGDLGLVLPEDPNEAAGVIAAALADPERSLARVQRAREYAERFRAPTVAAAYLDVYDAVVARPSRARRSRRTGSAAGTEGPGQHPPVAGRDVA
jgi:glycosyltransferase involved in cell wall biosynthesis